MTDDNELTPPADELARINLARLLELGEWQDDDFAVRCCLSSKSTAHAVGKLKRYLTGERTISWDMLDRFTAVLEVPRSEFLKELPKSGKDSPAPG